MVGLALTMSTSAGAVVSIGLVQVGGTFDIGNGANPGDTLVLKITYSLERIGTISGASSRPINGELLSHTGEAGRTGGSSQVVAENLEALRSNGTGNIHKSCRAGG